MHNGEYHVRRRYGLLSCYIEHLFLLLGRIAALDRCGELLPIRKWWSVGLSVTPVSPAKATESIVIPFGILTRLGTMC